jgi:hypothetical protein
MSFMNKVFDPERNKKYHPIFPDKYVGRDLPIMRSEWERQFARWCDTNPNVIQWSSEAFSIDYYDPIRKKNRRYYPDFLIKVKDKDNREGVYCVEIKPHKDIVMPKNGAKKDEKTKIHEAAVFITNTAKWKAADSYCKKRGITFRIITEKELFNKK